MSNIIFNDLHNFQMLYGMVSVIDLTNQCVCIFIDLKQMLLQFDLKVIKKNVFYWYFWYFYTIDIVSSHDDFLNLL